MSPSRASRLLLVAAAVASGGCAIAAEEEKEVPARLAAATGTGPARHFAILRRPRTAADQLPPGAEGIGTSYHGEPSAIPQRARLARTTPSGVTVWVVAGEDAICTYATEAGVPGGGGGCNDLSAVLEGYSLGSSSPAPNMTRLIGAVPDGVDEVVLRAKDGTVETTAPEGNVYVFETAHLPKEIEWGDNVVPAMSPLELP